MTDKYGDGLFGFEDLETYQAARAFRNRIYALVKTMPDCERLALAVQLRRAAISLTSNIAEGYGRYRWQDTTHFFHISRGSLMELVDGLSTCLDNDYVRPECIEDLRAEAAKVLRLLNGYIAYLQKNKSQTKANR